MASPSTAYYEDTLIEGYIRDTILSHNATTIPEDVKKSIISFHYYDNFCPDGTEFCTTNLIGNILTCRYSKLDLFKDIMGTCLKESMSSIVIVWTLFISWFSCMIYFKFTMGNYYIIVGIMIIISFIIIIIIFITKVYWCLASW